METYTSSRGRPEASPAAPPAGLPDGMPAGPLGPAAAPAGPDGLAAALELLAAAVATLAAVDPALEPDAALAAGVLAARQLLDQGEGAWLRLVAAADARGAPGAERGVCAPTAGWLRAECRTSPALAAQRVRTARALYRGPLPTVAAALARGEVSYQHAAALADATADLPPARVSEAEPVLLDAAARLDPPRLRRVAEHLRDLVDPEGADERGRARLGKRGLWLSPTLDGVDVRGFLDAEAGEAVQSALAPLARPAGPDDERNAPQRRADALGELARWALRAGGLPQEGGLRPNLTVTVDWDSLQAHDGNVGGVGGWGTMLPPETVRRLACDAVVTRAIVHRHPDLAATGHGGDGRDGGTLAAVLRAAVGLLPAPLGAPVELLDLGRTTRVVPPALRRALALRDGGCVAEGCGRPPAWCDAHHLVHWVNGGATCLECLVLLCRVHHVAAHEGGWRFVRDPASGRVTLVPPDRRGHDPPAA
ncbi:MAG TPA: DUF222 domain-containing protein [Actinomycetes bacterium]